MTHSLLLAASIFVLLHDAASAATASNRTKDRSTSTTKCLGYATCPSFPEPYATDNYPLTYDYKGTFPKDFAFGLGTAAYQIEGGYRQDGRQGAVSGWEKRGATGRRLEPPSPHGSVTSFPQMLMFPCRLRHFAHVNASDELHPSPLVTLFGTPPLPNWYPSPPPLIRPNPRVHCV